VSEKVGLTLDIKRFVGFIGVGDRFGMSKLRNQSEECENSKQDEFHVKPPTYELIFVLVDIEFEDLHFARL
jgi:hypothetical protein